jgi:hypothetical protein
LGKLIRNNEIRWEFLSSHWKLKCETEIRSWSPSLFFKNKRRTIFWIVTIEGGQDEIPTTVLPIKSLFLFS